MPAAPISGSLTAARVPATSAATSPMAIGEVLTSLRSEFPAITVSKIRFLDGAGLVSPQRSGSGYRRFSDADLLRLRQVLTLQRDHYLPLRVIRAHIAAGTLDRALVETPRPAADPAPRRPAEREPIEREPAEREPIEREPAEREPIERVPAERVPTEREPVAREGRAAVPAAAVPSGSGGPPAAARGTPPGAPVGRPANGAGSTTPAATRALAGHPRRLRIEDLLRLSGLPLETLTELETAGLLRSRNGWYHPEDLAVANAAAQLAGHGIGPRHLRSLRNAADRELGLLEQSLVPALRRARPDARPRAEETARTLRELYAQVHTALVTAGLRDLGIDPR